MLDQINIDFELIWKEINSSLSTEEKAELDKWLKSNQYHLKYYEKVRNFYASGKVHDEKPLNIPESWKKIVSGIGKKKERLLPGWLKIVVSVAATVAVMVSGYFIMESYKRSVTIAQQEEVQIPPGESRATLIMNDGEYIDLAEGQQFEKDVDGTTISNQDNQITYSGQQKSRSARTERHNILVIPRGGEYFIILSDGTKVFLNSDSKLRYPVNFIGDERLVELTGEAFFEVSEDARKPFRVMSGDMVAEVLGTSFNISSYEDESLIFTTLVDGRVNVFSKENPDEIRTLIPGFQTTYDKVSRNIAVYEVNVYEYVAWKDGIFSFRNKPLHEMMHTLSRWYDVDIMFKDLSKRNIRFTGNIPRYGNFENVLDLIERTYEVDFEISEKEIIVK